MDRRSVSMRKHLLALAAFTTMSLTANAENCEPEWNSFSSGGQIGLSGSVRALAVFQGDLIVGGSLDSAGGQQINHIARWDGTQWHTLESGGQVGVGGGSSAGDVAVDALAVWDDKLVVGGRFETAGGQEMNRIAMWDGDAWHPMITIDANDDEVFGIGAFNSIVYDLQVRGNDLVVAGFFETAGGLTMNNIARRVGSTWQAFDVDSEIGMNTRVMALAEWNGELIAGGRFRFAGGQEVNRIARWNGNTWLPFASGGQTGVDGPTTSVRIRSLVEHKEDLYVGGRFDTAGGQIMNHVARWDGKQWHPLTTNGLPGIDGSGTLEVYAMVEYQDDLIIAGFFAEAGGDTMNHIARWDGDQWHPFVVGEETGMQTRVQSVMLKNQVLLAGGIFNLAGGKEVRRLASWDGCADDQELIFSNRFEVP